MKKITFLVASVLMTSSIANANSVTVASTENRYNFDEPISFNERGIEFFVFLNGDFDFNTRPQDSQGDYYFKTAGKIGTKVVARNDINYGVLIEHDSFGRVRRIGNTFINYDSRNRVNRIGSVYMRYDRFALTQIGGMQIIYNRRGEIVDTFGSVKGFRNQGYAYTYQNHYHDNYVNYYTSNYQNDDNQYYKQEGIRTNSEKDKKDK